MRADERAMLQALGPAAVALQMAPSPREVLDNLHAAGFAVVPVVASNAEDVAAHEHWMAWLDQTGDAAFAYDSAGGEREVRFTGADADVIRYELRAAYERGVKAGRSMLAAAQEDGR